MTYSLKNTRPLDFNQLKELFESNGLYEDQLHLFMGFFKSPYVLSCWDNEKLIGVIRSIDDENFTAYIDNLLVHKDYQKQGIEKQLFDIMLLGLSNFKYIYFIPNNKNQVRLCKRKGFSPKRRMYLQKINGRTI